MVFNKDSYGKVTKERQTSSRPSPAAGVGNERKGDVHGAQRGGSEAETFHAAVDELHRQHPHHHSAGGVHHGNEHVRHIPMHGMKVASREYSRGGHTSPAAHPQHRGSAREGYVGHKPAGR